MSSEYAWVIIKDLIDGEDTGVIGPSDAPPELVAKLKAGEGERFRMDDDEGEAYYLGRIVGDYTFEEPLVDFGTPNAGAVALYTYDAGLRNWRMVIG